MSSPSRSSAIETSGVSGVSRVPPQGACPDRRRCRGPPSSRAAYRRSPSATRDAPSRALKPIFVRFGAGSERPQSRCYRSPMSFLDRALRMGEAKKFKSYEQRVSRINELEPEVEHYSDEELRGAADTLRERA